MFGNTLTQGLVSFSEDKGATWSIPAAVSKSFDTNAAIWDGLQYIAVGSTLADLPATYSSSDAIVWTENLLPITVLRNRPIASGNGFFMAGDSLHNAVYVSDTLAGLSSATATPVGFLPQTADHGLYCVGYGLFNGSPTFVAIGVSGGSALSLDNGSTWTPTKLNFGPGDSAQIVVFGNNTFVASGDAGDISTLP